jgi:hypothetical protein
MTTRQQSLASDRLARRTHRERKATYVKSIEFEVAELRKRNAVLEAGKQVLVNVMDWQTDEFRGCG